MIPFVLTCSLALRVTQGWYNFETTRNNEEGPVKGGSVLNAQLSVQLLIYCMILSPSVGFTMFIYVPIYLFSAVVNGFLQEVFADKVL